MSFRIEFSGPFMKQYISELEECMEKPFIILDEKENRTLVEFPWAGSIPVGLMICIADRCNKIWID